MLQKTTAVGRGDFYSSMDILSGFVLPRMDKRFVSAYSIRIQTLFPYGNQVRMALAYADYLWVGTLHRRSAAAVGL